MKYPAINRFSGLELKPEIAQAVDQEISDHFKKYQAKATIIKRGMNAVFGHKVNLISYLPVADIKSRVAGKSSYTMAELK